MVLKQNIFKLIQIQQFFYLLYRFYLPNTKGAINSQRIITDEDDVANLQNECSNDIFKKLIRSHDLSKKEVSVSNLELDCVVAVQIRVKKLPYQY